MIDSNQGKKVDQDRILGRNKVILKNNARIRDLDLESIKKIRNTKVIETIKKAIVRNIKVIKEIKGIIIKVKEFDL